MQKVPNFGMLCSFVFFLMKHRKFQEELYMKNVEFLKNATGEPIVSVPAL